MTGVLAGLPLPTTTSITTPITLGMRRAGLIRKVKVKVAQLCLTLCDPIVHGILQARILERVAFPFSRGSSQPRDRTQVSHIAGRFLPAEPPGTPRKAFLCALVTSESRWASVPLWCPVCPGPVTQAPPQPVA